MMDWTIEEDVAFSRAEEERWDAYLRDRHYGGDCGDNCPWCEDED